MRAIFLLALATTAFSEEAVVAAAQQSSWQQMLLTIFSIAAIALGTIVTTYTTKFLKAKADEARAKLNDTNLDTVSKIKAELESIVYDVVSNINEKEFQKLVLQVANKELDSADAIKARLKELGNTALSEVIKIASDRGIDVVATVGKDWLITKIRSIVDEKSPIVGDTAEGLLNGGANWLVEKGKEKIKEWAK